MSAIRMFWDLEPVNLKLLMFILFALGLISVVRFVKLARLLYHYSGDPVSHQGVAEGKVAPKALARASLASQVVWEAVPERSSGAERSMDTVTRKKALDILRVAERRFFSLWESCYADVESAKRASLLGILLSFAMVTSGYPLDSADHYL